MHHAVRQAILAAHRRGAAGPGPPHCSGADLRRELGVGVADIEVRRRHRERRPRHRHLRQPDRRNAGPSVQPRRLEVRDKAERIAAHLLEAAEEIELADGSCQGFRARRAACGAWPRSPRARPAGLLAAARHRARAGGDELFLAGAGRPIPTVPMSPRSRSMSRPAT